MAAGRHLEFHPTGNGAVGSAVPKKPHPRTKHEVDRLTRCSVMAIWNFPKMCEWALRSVVGRQSSVGRQYSYFLHWSHILLFRYVRSKKLAISTVHAKNCSMTDPSFWMILMSRRSTFVSLAGSITRRTASTQIGDRILEYCDTTWQCRHNISTQHSAGPITVSSF